MGIVATQNSEVRSFKGLHLYHAGRSNCSARVRLLLAEKHLPWVSHHVDIYSRANVTPEYFSIHPKGLVPALVHDGRVVVESNDILLYLEQAFPEPGFTPPVDPDRKRMENWLQRSGSIHIPGIKTYAYARSHARNVVKTPEEVALYRELQKDPELLAFHARHDLPGASFSDEDVDSASRLVGGTLQEMDGILAASDWLVGGVYSLADISWAPSITTLQGVGFPVTDYPNVMAWYGRCGKRPAFQRAVTAWREQVRDGIVEIDADGQ